MTSPRLPPPLSQGATWRALAPGRAVPEGEAAEASHEDALLDALLDGRALDRFDRAQLREVVAVCRRSRTLSEAGRALFAVSRAERRSTNDADRLRKVLGRYGLSFEGVVQAALGS